MAAGKNRDGLEAGRPFPGNDMAFDALRMMVNLNRLEDAAGAVAYLSLAFNTLVDRLGGKRVRQSLRKGGSVFKNTICINSYNFYIIKCFIKEIPCRPMGLML